MSQSKNGLANDRLMRSNSLVSSDCSQCIGDNVAEIWRLKTQLRDRLEFKLQPQPFDSKNFYRMDGRWWSWLVTVIDRRYNTRLSRQ
jgi:hypothetical protein